jgi:cysteinyl-tRNA synthetase
MVLLQSHYRSPVRVGQENVDAAVKSLAGLDSFAARSAAHLGGTVDAPTRAKFVAAMDDDLDTATAMAVVFDAVRAANAAVDSGDAQTAAHLRATVMELAGVLGLELSLGDTVDADVEARAAALDAARAAKDFATADAIRNELQAAGWLVETTKEGTRVRRG